MYQSLIWPSVLGDHSSRLRPALDAQRRERLANALVDGVRRNAELGCDFLGIEMLVDEEEAIELARSQSGDARGHQVRRFLLPVLTRRISRSV